MRAVGPEGEDISVRGKSREKTMGTGVHLACLRNGKNRMREENRWRWGREKKQLRPEELSDR